MRFRPLLKWWLVLTGAALVLRLATAASPAPFAAPATEGLPAAGRASF